MAKHKTRSIRRYSIKRHSRRHSSGLGTFAPLIGGVAAGALLSIASPYIKQYVPDIGPVPAVAVGAIAIGAGTKLLLKKDPMKIPSGLMVLGGAMVGMSLLSGFSAGTTSTGGYM
jgi:uncharacterized membrane protein (UPF0136 family)